MSQVYRYSDDFAILLFRPILISFLLIYFFDKPYYGTGEVENGNENDISSSFASLVLINPNIAGKFSADADVPSSIDTSKLQNGSVECEVEATIHKGKSISKNRKQRKNSSKTYYGLKLYL